MKPAFTCSGGTFHAECINQNLFGRIIRNLQPAGRPPKDREWWRQVRPWLRHLSKILKFVPKLSDLAKAYDEQWYKSIDLSVEIYDAGAGAFPEFAARTERSARHELDVVMGKEVEAEGAALRALHVFLREVDKTQHWCGLKRVVTNDGNILWLCAEHARFHEV